MKVQCLTLPTTTSPLSETFTRSFLFFYYEKTANNCDENKPISRQFPLYVQVAKYCLKLRCIAFNFLGMGHLEKYTL